MTREEAIASLKALCHTCEFFPTCVNDKPECFRAIEMAIKSLEAWGKVKNDICEIDWYGDDAFWDGVNLVSDIIDKHLSEVSE